MATDRSGFKTEVVKRCPFMWSERESGGSLQCKKKTLHTLHCRGSLMRESGTFLEWLNSHYPVHFTWNTPQSHVTFLDVNVHIDQGQLHTSVHIKPSAISALPQLPPHIDQTLYPLFPCYPGGGASAPNPKTYTPTIAT